MKINKELKDTHKGERCFVFGNGPSAKDLDLSLFKNEFVFTVNQIARNPHFSEMKTNVHFWADPNFFDLDLTQPENAELLEQMKGVNTDDNRPLCFFPLDYRDYIVKNRLDTYLDTRYFLPSYPLELFMERENRFDDLVPTFYTVVHYAIFLALYMGFSEIYLLGCENSGILTTIKVRTNEDLSDTYGYDLTDNEKKRLKDLRQKVTFTEELYAFYKVTQDYELLDEYSKSHNSHLYNCTPKSLVQSIEKKSLQEVLKA